MGCTQNVSRGGEKLGCGGGKNQLKGEKARTRRPLRWKPPSVSLRREVRLPGGCPGAGRGRGGPAQGGSLCSSRASISWAVTAREQIRFLSAQPRGSPASRAPQRRVQRRSPAGKRLCPCCPRGGATPCCPSEPDPRVKHFFRERLPAPHHHHPPALLPPPRRAIHCARASQRRTYPSPGTSVPAKPQPPRRRACSGRPEKGPVPGHPRAGAARRVSPRPPPGSGAPRGARACGQHNGRKGDSLKPEDTHRGGGQSPEAPRGLGGGPGACPGAPAGPGLLRPPSRDEPGPAPAAAEMQLR